MNFHLHLFHNRGQSRSRRLRHALTMLETGYQERQATWNRTVGKRPAMNLRVAFAPALAAKPPILFIRK